MMLANALSLCNPTLNAGGGYANVFNYNPAYLSQWKAARAEVLAGTGNAVVMAIGDSKTMGRGAGTSTSVTQPLINGAREKAYPKKLADLFVAAGVPTITEGFAGGSGVSTADMVYYNPRFGAFGTGVTLATFGIGGNLINFASGSVGTLKFTPAAAVDTMVIPYLRTANSAILSLMIDGVEVDTLDTAGTSGIARKTFSFTKGTPLIEIAHKSGAFVAYLLGADVYDSTTPAVHLINAGASGSTLANWGAGGAVYSASGSGLNAGFIPDLSLINLGTNDDGGGYNIATLKGYYQTLITKAKLTGDVALIVPGPKETQTPEVLADFHTMYRELAVENGCILFDIYGRWGSWAAADALGYYAEGTHESEAGYADQAAFFASVLLA